MKRLIALLLCLLMLTALTACKQHNHNPDPTVPPKGEVTTLPIAENADDSVLIGTWTVTAQTSPLDRLTFSKEGIVQAHFNGHTLGGVFFDDGSKLTIHISQQTMEGSYTVDGDTVTFVTANDTLIFKKV